MNKKQTITVLAQNTPGVLYRLADLFLRRKINIERLTVFETKQNGISRFTIVASISDEVTRKLCKQIERIIEVSRVSMR
jgi:acetolactate synthase-1/3 small subunit